MLSSYWLTSSYLFYSMARTKVMPKKDAKGRPEVGAPVQGREKRISRERIEASSPVHHPSPARKPSPMREEEKRLEEAEKWVEETRWLEDVGRSMSSSPTQQLTQMAVEAGPSDLGRKEPVRRKLHPTVGGKAPWKEFLWAG